MRRACLLVAFATVLAGCGQVGSDIPVVAFVQYTSTSSLDDCRTGFVRGLKEGGFTDGVNVKIVLQNAHADNSTLNLMVQKFRDDDVKLVGTASTQALQAASRTLKDIPVVFSGVIDPVAAGAGTSMDTPQTNITGVYNPFPVADGARLVHRVLPTVKVIGTLFDPSEPFSNSMQKEAMTTCQELGIKWVAVPISGATDIIPGMQALKARGVEALLQLPTNTVNQGIDAQIAEGAKLGIAIFSLQTDQVPKGVVVALGIDFEKAGAEAGMIAADVLKGKKPSEIRMKKAEVQGIGINLAAAEKYGIKIDPALLRQAREVVAK